MYTLYSRTWSEEAQTNWSRPENLWLPDSLQTQMEKELRQLQHDSKLTMDKFHLENTMGSKKRSLVIIVLDFRI